MLRMARSAHAETGLPNLCLAGGVALNCVGNGRILREGPFERVWIQPAAGDAGGAVGVAQLIWHRYLENPRSAADRDGMSGAYLGPSFGDAEIESVLKAEGAVWEQPEPDELIRRTAACLADQEVVGWFDGRMEFGPRALGARSILADPRSARMQSKINRKIKFRESFRPFAPSVLEHRREDYFDLGAESPYMLLVAPVREELRLETSAEGDRGAVDLSTRKGFELLQEPRSEIPAVTHVDYSARVQTVSRERSPRYFDLISEFEALTGCGLLVNTSFNVRGEPIVCTPEDAWRCFMRTDMDVLVLGPYLLRKEDQPAWTEERDWRDEFVLD